MPYNCRPAALLVSLAGLSFLVLQIWPPPATAARSTGLSGLAVPRDAAGFQWQGDHALPAASRAELASTDSLVRRYAHPTTGQEIELTLISGTDRSVLHDPRDCLDFAGWRIVDDHPETLPGTDVTVRYCRVSGGPTGQESYEMLDLYVADGKPIYRVTEIRTRMLMAALVGRSDPVYFMRFLRPVGAESPIEAEQRERFGDFAAAIWHHLGLTANNRATSSW